MKKLIAAICVVLIPMIASAQVPQLMNYQGRIQVGGVDFEGQGHFKFALVGAGGPNAETLWRNDGSVAGSEPAAAVRLTVTKGLYSVLLGDATRTNMQVLPASVFGSGEVYLRIWFSDGVHNFEQLRPDQRIAAVGYAITAATVLDGAITSEKLDDQAITTGKLADGAVTSSKIRLDSIRTQNIADGAITEEKIDARAVARHNIQVGAITPTQVAETFGLWERNPDTQAFFRRAGNVGIGAANPEMPLDVRGAEPEVSRFTGSSPLGTWFGLENTSAGGERWSFISTGAENSEGAGKLLFFGHGQPKMQLDGAGNLAVKGSVTALNSPSIKYSQEGGLGSHHVFFKGEWHDIDVVNFKAPAAGYLFITAYAVIACGGVTGGGFEIGLDEGPTNNRLTTVNLLLPPTISRQTAHLSWVLPVSEARTVLLKLVGVLGTTSGEQDAIAQLGTHNLSVIYIPQLAQ